MNAYLPSSGIELWQIAGWTMIHFLWLGTLVGLMAATARVALGRATPNVRYVVALVCFTLLAALPMGISAWLVWNHEPSSTVASAAPADRSAVGRPAPDPADNGTTATSEIIELAPTGGDAQVTTLPVVNRPPQVSASTLSNLDEPSPSASLIRRGISVVAIEPWVGYLPWIWIVGTPITFALLAAGIVGTKRLRSASRVIDDGPITELMARLTASLRIGKHVTVAICDRIAAPVLVGIVRPLILLPPAALTGWSPDEIEMVLLHELAHVRRWDNLVNLLQRLVESLLFFHPVVWLVSTWVRRERETCCDAAVVARTNRPHAYAEMLVALAAQMPRSVLFHPAASSAMAAGPLRKRIRSILGLQDDPMLISGKSFVLVLAGLLVAATLAVLYLPTIGQAEESTTESTEKTDPPLKVDAPPEKVRQAQTQNNLKNLGLAILNYEAATKKLPAHANYGADGKPLLSWRVAILPYLDEAQLYSQFHLDEPWDSDHNRKLIARMPDVFQNPKLNQPGKTNYLAVVGKECVFNGSPQGLGLRAVADGTSRTIAVVEADADRACEWTRPHDWTFERKHPTAGLGSLWADYWNAVWVDGSVRRIANSEPADAVGINFTRAGGETRSLKVSEGRLGSVEGGLPAGPEGGMADASASLTSETDDSWPEGVAFPSPKEGEISKRAYEALGLKVVPAVIEEGTEGAYEVEVIGGADLPPGTTGPVLLTDVADANTRNFDELAEALKIVIPNGWTPIGCIATREGEQLQLKFPAGSLELRRGIQRRIESTPPSSDEEQVFATLPPATDGMEYVKEYGNALVEAEKNNLQLQRVFRDGKELLIATPLPTEADWPAVLGDPPRKERVIADRAWQRLGLKLVPLSSSEADFRRDVTGKPLGLRIVGGNLPKGLPVWAVLTTVDGSAADSMDNLLAWLESDSGRSQMVVRCYAMVGDKEYLFEAGPPPTPAQSTPKSITYPGPAKQKKFPSLEDQKLADLAWKRLGLELESLNPDELRRVQALGYEGGVRVAEISSQRGDPKYNDVQVQDVLVGLHVWPTTSMKDVATVLARDDIADLSPLKFYVVRHEFAGGTEKDPQFSDNEITGRISVQPENRDYQNTRQRAASVLQPTPTLNDPTTNNPYYSQQPKPLREPAPSGLPSLDRYPVPAPTATPSNGEPQPEIRRSTAAPNPYIPRVTIAPASPSAPTIAPVVPQQEATPYQKLFAPLATPSLPTQPTAPAAIAELPVAPEPLLREAPELTPAPDRLRLFYFYSDDSEPSKKMQDVVDQVAKKYAEYFELERVDVANQPNTTKRFHVTRVPSLLLVRNDQVIGEIVGLRSINEVDELIASHIPRSKVAIAGANVTSSTAGDKSKLRYEGKSFEQWQNEWQTELSTEKRVAAINALAAFGAAGYGEEAAKTLLDIVNQYDWSLIDGAESASGKLQNAAFNAFGGVDPWNRGRVGAFQSIASKHWLPILLERLPDDENIQQFSQWVLPSLGPDARFATDDLIKLSRNGPENVRNPVLQALNKIDPKHQDERINSRWRELLDSKNPDDMALALWASPSVVEAFDLELMPLLMNEKDAVQQAARGTLRFLKPAQWDEFFKALVAIVDDPKRAKDHVAAIRAIGRLGVGGGLWGGGGFGGDGASTAKWEKVNEATGWLDKLMMDPKKPVEIRTVAMNALLRLTNVDNEDRLRNQLQEEKVDRATYQKFKDAVQNERNMGW